MDDRQLQTVWQQRQVYDRVTHLSAPLGSFLKRDLSRRVRQVGKIAEIWQELLPEELLQRTSLESFQRGVLTVAVDSASHRFMLQTLLQGGLQRQIQSRFSGTLQRIKLVAGQFDASNASTLARA
ncbi:MAG: DciA family protein [Phycisphaerae bacterium]